MPKKQSDGRYRAKITIGATAEGKPITKYVSGRTTRELEDAKKAAREHYINGAVAQRDRLFGEYAIEWYNANKKPHLTRGSQINYRAVFNKYLLPPLGDRMMRAIKPTELQEIMNGFSGMNATAATMALSILRAVFRTACQEGILQRDPSAFLTKPKPKATVKKRALTNKEREAVVKTAREHSDGLLLAVLFYLGLRRGEALGMQWRDIDFSESTLHVQRNVDVGARLASEERVTPALKTQAGNRVVTIPAPLMEMLIAKRGFPNAFLFQMQDGLPLSEMRFRDVWTSLMQHAGLAGITPHYLRHNYVTMLYESGIDPLIAMRLVGHADYKTTANIYTHLNNTHMQSAKSKLDSVFEI